MVFSKVVPIFAERFNLSGDSKDPSDTEMHFAAKHSIDEVNNEDCYVLLFFLLQSLNGQILYKAVNIC